MISDEGESEREHDVRRDEMMVMVVAVEREEKKERENEIGRGKKERKSALLSRWQND